MVRSIPNGSPSKPYTWIDYSKLVVGGVVHTFHYNGSGGNDGGGGAGGGGGGYSAVSGGGAGGGGGSSFGNIAYAGGGVVAAGGNGGAGRGGGWYNLYGYPRLDIGQIEPDGLAPMVNYERHA